MEELKRKYFFPLFKWIYWGKLERLMQCYKKKLVKPVNFKEMAETLCEVIESNVFVVSRRGKLLGIALLNSKLRMRV